jgi:putative CocE/NonD family hydrolase
MTKRLGRGRQALLLVLAIPAVMAARQTSAAAPPIAYDVMVAKNVMVPMRDGVRLATDVYRPAHEATPAPESFPVLLARTPYGKTSMEESGRFLAAHGYVVVLQDVRGRYDSEGTFYIYLNEGRDGFDTVEWAAKQPWSNGKVGTFGASYLAGAQNALAVEGPPHLAAMFVLVGTADYHEDGAARGGATYLLHNLAYALNLAATSREASADPVLESALRRQSTSLASEATDTVRQFGEWLRAYPFRPNGSPLLQIPAYQRWFQDFVDHPNYDEYWKQNGFTFDRYHGKYPDIPIYFVSGWYDIFLRGTLHNYVGLSSRQRSPKKLLLGAWVHGVGSSFAGDVDFGLSAAVDIQQEQLRWFDHVLKGRDTGVLNEPAVRLFVMGGGDGSRTREGRLNDGGVWRTATGWPLPDARPHSYYFHADGTLNEQVPTAESPSVYTFDPAHPVPTIGGQIDSGKELAPDGPHDQRCTATVFGCENTLPLAARHDVLVFKTPPLDADVVVAGPLTVELWVSSSAPDTDFTAKLIDEFPANRDYPAGYAMNLADRIARVRYSKSAERPELLKPGEVRNVTVDLLGIANRFKKGHRIRVDISSSNFPFFDVNSNTDDRIGQRTRMASAINVLYHDREHPSHVVLPLLQTTDGPSNPQSTR